MTVKGMGKHIARLKAAQNVAEKITRALYIAGQRIEIDAETSITDGSVSGAGHVPSLPGQPPNADTHHLDSNIETTIEAQNPPTVHVTSRARYSAALEFGTSKMAARPFMRPATEKNRDKVAQQVATAVNITIKSGG